MVDQYKVAESLSTRPQQDGEPAGQLLGRLAGTASLEPVLDGVSQIGEKPISEAHEAGVDSQFSHATTLPETDTVRHEALIAKESTALDVGARSKAIQDIVKRYNADPRIEERLAPYRSRSPVRKNLDDSTGVYLSEISQFRLLTRDDERTLFSAIDRGLSVYQDLEDLGHVTPDQEEAFIALTVARRAIFVCNLKLVVSIAKQYRNFYEMMPLQDCIQEGNTGLAVAIEKFNVSKGFKFSTYATWWIRQAISREIANTGRAIRLPVHGHEQWMIMQAASRDLRENLNREPTLEELATSMGMTPQRVIDLQRVGAPHLDSLNQKVGDNADAELGELIPDPKTDVGTMVVTSDDALRVRNSLTTSGLSTGIKLALSLRYRIPLEDLGGTVVKTARGPMLYEDLYRQLPEPTNDGLTTLQEVGDLLGMTRERVRQLEGDGFRRLQKTL